MPPAGRDCRHDAVQHRVDNEAHQLAGSLAEATLPSYKPIHALPNRARQRRSDDVSHYGQAGRRLEVLPFILRIFFNGNDCLKVIDKIQSNM